MTLRSLAPVAVAIRRPGILALVVAVTVSTAGPARALDHSNTTNRIPKTYDVLKTLEPAQAPEQTAAEPGHKKSKKHRG